ncbi:MAG: cytochrome c biogenesis protein CcdA [Patescibacteria group bacterium]|mgnify:CR=1 FL=1
MKPKRDWNIFFSAVFFVLGFSLIFSLLGVLLQTVLSNLAYSAQIWAQRIGGAVIILFGLYLVGLIRIPFLEREYKLKVRGHFRSHFVTSFLFGAAFAAGWTPCVSAALGAILALASSNPSSAFILLFAYTLGIGIPFLLVGLFTTEAQNLIGRAGKKLLYFQYVFGAILIAIGVLMFVGDLSKIANFEILADILLKLNIGTGAGEGIASLSFVSFGVALFAGFASFLSPCILPIVPGFLTYLASTASKSNQSNG